MNDKKMMEGLLGEAKGACDLYMHGAIESSTPAVHLAFVKALEETLCIQNQIYNAMSEKGWYPAEQAEQQKLTQVKEQYRAAAENTPR